MIYIVKRFFMRKRIYLNVPLLIFRGLPDNLPDCLIMLFVRKRRLKQH